MIVVRLRVPPSALGKARLAGMVFGVIDLLAQLGNLGNPARPPEWRFVSAAGLLLLIGAMATTTIRRRPFLLEPLLVPVLVVVVGSGLVDSVATFGVCIGAAVAQSMYGSHRGWALRTVLLCAAFLSAVAVSPYSIGGRWISWHSPTLIAMVPQLLMLSVLVRGLYYLREAQPGRSRLVSSFISSSMPVHPGAF